MFPSFLTGCAFSVGITGKNSMKLITVLQMLDTRANASARAASQCQRCGYQSASKIVPKTPVSIRDAINNNEQGTVEIAIQSQFISAFQFKSPIRPKSPLPTVETYNKESTISRNSQHI
jgi:hypothetical protein